ncbi:sulfatase-like hydrolase/transferase, partial [Pontiellaceae bacterium B12219]|nr:sulfatase-like hydrolase/transferase [Pontiellaceae bacterium B12219]
WGQFAVGTFVASGTTQLLTHKANSFGNIHFNAILVVEATVRPPGSPTGLMAESLDSAVRLSWEANTQYGFSHYVVKRASVSGGPYTPLPGATPTDNSYTDSSVSNGTSYYYVVSAVNIEDEESADSTEVEAVPAPYDAPEVPVGLESRAGNRKAFLEWDDNLQTGFKAFQVKRALQSGGPYALIETVTDSAFIDTSLTNEVSYYYVVSALNLYDEESANSIEMEVIPSASAAPPNFLFIIADDMDTYAVNAYRRTEPSETDANGNFYAIDTPNMDRLAEEGMMFHQARLMGANVGAVCTPSRTTIMTGKNTWERDVDVTAATTFPGVFNRGVRSNAIDLPYVTYRTCKNGNSYPTANAEFQTVNDATKRGNTDGGGSEWHGDRGVDYIADWNENYRTNDTPFMMYLGFSHPHDTRNAREELTGRYNCVNTTDPSSLVLNTNAPPLPYNHLSCTPETYPAHPFDHGHLGVRDENTASGIGQYRTEAVIRNEIGRNFACVDWIDQQIGRVLERLDDPNGDGDTSDSVVDNTYIVFTSDHGIAIGRHGLQGKQNLYEHTWRVPYIVRGPGIEPGSESDALIYLHDTFPTFCDLAGIDVPETIDSNDGQSFRPVLEGAADEHRDVLYGLYAGGDKPGIRAVTDGRFKLMKYDVGENNTQVTQLFDLEQNPFELLPEHGVPNLAQEPAYALIRQQLEEKLMEKRIEYADPYNYLGDRTLFRFEGDLSDRLPFGHTGAASNGAAFSAAVPDAMEYVVGETNATSLDLEQDLQQYVKVSNGPGLNFGNNPFTIEAWVKLETLPVSNDEASAMPLVQKKVIGANDSALDYLFLAAAGNYGSASTYNRLALHLGSASIISTLAIPDTDWHYISVSLDPVSDTVRFRLDELTDTQSTTAVGTVNDGPLIIGAHYTSSGEIDSTFDGLIDELSITDGFLADAELQPLQNLPEPLPAQLYAPTITAEGISLNFDSNASFLYDIESKERLTDPEWMLEQSYVWDAGDTISVDLGGAASTSTFYRVKTKSPYRN